MRFGRKIRSLWHDCGGAVTMEYLLLCVMLATGALMMVITFSRAVVRQFALVSYAMSGYAPDRIEQGRDFYRESQKEDAVVANVYADFMHGEKVSDKK